MRKSVPKEGLDSEAVLSDIRSVYSSHHERMLSKVFCIVSECHDLFASRSHRSFVIHSDSDGDDERQESNSTHSHNGLKNVHSPVSASSKQQASRPRLSGPRRRLTPRLARDSEDDEQDQEGSSRSRSHSQVRSSDESWHSSDRRFVIQQVHDGSAEYVPSASDDNSPVTSNSRSQDGAVKSTEVPSVRTVSPHESATVSPHGAVKSTESATVSPHDASPDAVQFENPSSKGGQAEPVLGSKDAAVRRKRKISGQGSQDDAFLQSMSRLSVSTSDRPLTRSMRRKMNAKRQKRDE